MHPDDALLAKVRKLLAKAEDPAATPAEAETYTAKASALIAEYGIDQALLAQHDPERDPVTNRKIRLDAPYAADKADLLGTVALALRCTAVRLREYDVAGRQVSLHLFGHASDLHRVEVLFTSLLMQSTLQMTATPVPTHEHAAAFRRSWLAGFTRAVGQRLRQAEERAARDQEQRFAEAGTSAAVVLADRSSEVEAALREEYPALGFSRPRRLSGSGGGQGWAAGQRADLGGRSFARGRRALPGRVS